MKMKVMGEVTGMMGVMLLNLGKEAGVWKAMRGGESVTPSQLAKTSGLSERYLEELLRASALHGYIKYTPGSEPVNKDWDSGITVMEGETFALSLIMFFTGAPFEISHKDIYQTQIKELWKNEALKE